jgi:hypothetical protein
LFDASMKLVPAVSTQLRIAKCREHESRLATTWAAYDKTLVLIALGGLPPNQQEEAEKFVKDARAELDPKVPKLRVVVLAPPPGLRVTLDGQDMPLDMLEGEVPVDPGRVTIVAGALGYESESWTVNMEAGQHRRIEILLVPSLPPHPVPVPTPPPPPGLGPRRIAGLVIGGVGVIGLAVTTGVGVEKLNMQTLIKPSSCPPGDTACSSLGMSFTDMVHAWQTAAIASVVASGALVGVGVAIFATAPGGTSSAPRAALVAGPAWAGVRGSW